MSRVEQFQEALLELFSDRTWQECLSSPQNIEEFAVIDQEQTDGRRRAIIVQEILGDEPKFVVQNPDYKVIFLFSLDDCFFTSSDTKRCDCLIYEDSCFCFVELKLDVTSRRQATSRLKDARDQLGATILFFRDTFETVDFWGAKLEAYVAMTKNLYPRSNANRQQVFVKFLEEYNVPLYEKNTKCF